MAEAITILATCWRLVTAIDTIVTRIKRTRADGKALTFLQGKVVWFLQTVNAGLAGRDGSPYLESVQYLESLLCDILEGCSSYELMSPPRRFINATRTKVLILDLNERLRFFIDAYLVQTAAHNEQLNLERLAQPLPPPALQNRTAAQDEEQWEIMTHQGESTIGARGRIPAWLNGVRGSDTETIVTENFEATEVESRVPRVDYRKLAGNSARSRLAMRATNNLEIIRSDTPITGSFVIDPTLSVPQSSQYNLRISATDSPINAVISLVDGRPTHMRTTCERVKLRLESRRTDNVYRFHPMVIKVQRPEPIRFHLKITSGYGSITVHLPRCFLGLLHIEAVSGILLSEVVQEHAKMFRQTNGEIKCFIGDYSGFDSGSSTAWEGDEVFAKAENDRVNIRYVDETLFWMPWRK